MNTIAADDRWLIFQLADQFFSIDVAIVRELTRDEQPPTRIPGQSNEVLGTINFRGTVVPVFDLRTILGLEPLEAETSALLDKLAQLKQDHVGWIEELERAVREDDTFGLARDHHMCAFGKWYDEFARDEKKLGDFCNGSPNLISAIRKFDSPHQIIHATADRALNLSSSGDHDAAMKVINDTRETALASMVGLFDQVSALLRELRKPIVVVLDQQAGNIALLVDRVDAVVEIDPEQIDTVPSLTERAEIIHAIYKDTDRLISILDPAPLIKKYQHVEASTDHDSALAA